MSQACAINIGPRQRHLRLVLGIAFMLLGIGLTALLESRDAPVIWRLGLFIPFWLSLLGLLQAREKT